MKTIIRVENPDEAEVTLTITMKLKEWRELREQLAARWPSREISKAIGNAVGRLTRHLTGDDEPDE